MIDEQIYLTRVAGSFGGMEDGEGGAGPLVPCVGPTGSLVCGWARVMRLSFTWRSGASDENRWVAPGRREGIGRSQGKQRLGHLCRESSCIGSCLSFVHVFYASFSQFAPCSHEPDLGIVEVNDVYMRLIAYVLSQSTS